jgi:hypothetical protein
VARAAASGRIAAAARRIWSATANPDGPGLLERGREYAPTSADEFEPVVVDGVVTVARLAESVAEVLRDCPDPAVRLSAAVLAARAHPIRVALDVAVERIA